MRKEGTLFTIVSFVFSLLLVNSVYAANLFTETFGTGTDWTTSLPAVWTASNDATSGMDDQLSITGGSDGNRYAWLNGLTGASNDQYINKTAISTIGYNNIKISYHHNLQRSGVSNDFLLAQWKLSSGSIWNDIQKVTASPGWNFESFDLPGAENTLIDIRFLEDGFDQGEFILIDDVNITGNLISNCGNNVSNEGEHCDDGNDINNDECTNACTITFCGDGVAQQPNGQGTGGPQNNGTEACDDGNLNNNDGCDNNCVSSVPICGNTIIESPETCDDGNTANNDGCSSTCQIEIPPGCGDGNVGLGEQCELPNTANNGGCSQTTSTCQGTKQGTRDGLGDCNSICDCVEDSFVFQCAAGQCGAQCDSNDDCNDLNSSTIDTCNLDTCGCVNIPIAVCGNGIPEGNEQCDDGNANNNDACKNNCTFNVCGDNVIETGVEQCDDGNNFNLDGCNQFCQNEFCGDGIIQLPLGEQCDDANFNNHDDCLNSCQNPACGDGFLWSGNEQCDDGNNANGDGCSAICNFEGGGACFAPVDVMLVIDRSGSMSVIEGGNTRLQNAKNASITFVNNVNFSKDEVGLASFNNLATLNLGLNNSLALITAAINSLTASGATNIGDGIKVGRQELVAHGGPTKALILLSDGAPNVMSQPNGSIQFCFVEPTSPTDCTIYAINQSNITKNAGIEVFTIGVGNLTNFTKDLLKEMASSAANFFFAPNSTVLESIYLKIAQEICPCQGFDCSINSDQCNIGACNLGNDQCEFNPQPQSTSCEEDSTKCTSQHCDGGGACVVNETVDVPPAQQCQSFYCDSLDGQVKSNVTGFPLSKPCSTDSNLCTTQHCNGQGQCVVNATTPVPPPEQCKSFLCDPVDGQIKVSLTDFPLSKPCSTDNNLCTTQHCNGEGACVVNETVDVPPAQQCQSFYCDPLNGQIKSNFSGFPISKPCDTDQNLCTTQHCNGGGQCVVNATTPVPPPEQCQSFFCDPVDGGIKPDIFQPLSTPCSTDDNECTIQHCNGGGSCVINPDAPLPQECKSEIIKDSKVSQSLPTSNFGLGRYMIVNPKQGSIDRSYLRIDASPILGDVVASANLTIAVYQTGGNASGSVIQAFYCREHDFVETTINWNNQPINNGCSLADSFVVPSEVVAGTPETFHTFNLTNETNFELASGDGFYTVVLKSAEENTGLAHNKKYVQYLTKDYPESDFRPKLEVS